VPGPLVTIITPTYNHEAFIGECIKSVMAQTYENWEQIIVDDCSCDRTLEIARGFRDSRIRVVRKQRHGGVQDLHVSYNSALQMARGELVAIVEGDDYWLRDKLATQVPYHLDRNIVLSWGATYARNGHKLKKDVWYSRSPKIIPDTSTLLVNNCIPALTTLMDKAALRKAGGFWQPGTPFVDHPTWLKLSALGDFLYIPQTLAVYRLHGHQVSRIHRHRMDPHSYPYVFEFLSGLRPERKRRMDLRKLHALINVVMARSNLTKGRYGVFVRLMARALFQAGASNRWICLSTLLHKGACAEL
jgi:glycosyltransferase involved in cell wall biosynthesis